MGSRRKVRCAAAAGVRCAAVEPGSGSSRPSLMAKARRRAISRHRMFYRRLQSDFKRPYGSGGGASPPSTYGGGAAPASGWEWLQPSGYMPQQGRPAGHMPQDGYGYGAAGGVGTGAVGTGSNGDEDSEIKAELKSVASPFNDCFRQESLAAKLNDAGGAS